MSGIPNSISTINTNNILVSNATNISSHVISLDDMVSGSRILNNNDFDEVISNINLIAEAYRNYENNTKPFSTDYKKIASDFERYKYDRTNSNKYKVLSHIVLLERNNELYSFIGYLLGLPNHLGLLPANLLVFTKSMHDEKLQYIIQCATLSGHIDTKFTIEI